MVAYFAQLTIEDRQFMCLFPTHRNHCLRFNIESNVLYEWNHYFNTRTLSTLNLRQIAECSIDIFLFSKQFICAAEKYCFGEEIAGFLLKRKWRFAVGYSPQVKNI